MLWVASNQIANTAPVALSGTGVLNVNGFSDSIGSLSLSAGTVQTGAGLLTLKAASFRSPHSCSKVARRAPAPACSPSPAYSALLAQAGTAKLFTALCTGASTVNVTPTGARATAFFNTGQTLASLTIGNGGVVNNEPLPSLLLPFDESAIAETQPVPEPGALILLALGAAGLLARRSHRRPKTKPRSGQMRGQRQAAQARFTSSPRVLRWPVFARRNF